MAAFVSSPIHLFIVFSSNSLVRQDVTLHRTVDLANQVLQVTLSHRSGMQLFVYSWPVLKARYVLVANVSPSVVRPSSVPCCQHRACVVKLQMLSTECDYCNLLITLIKCCQSYVTAIKSWPTTVLCQFIAVVILLL